MNDVLPHTRRGTPCVSLTPKGRCFADIQPMTDEFGWSRRNAFIQPQVDAVMYHGLQRFPQVRCLFSPRRVEAFSQTGDCVTLNLKGPDGERETRARGLAGGLRRRRQLFYSSYAEHPLRR